MHAVIVNVELQQDFETAQQRLRGEVVPRVSQAPGFVAGYWLAPEDGRGFSVVVFESEEAATRVAGMARSMADESVTVTDVQVREVIAQA